jgi:plasmid stability protein
MATLYVENIPDDLYEALRRRARGSRRSISAEVIELLQENVPTRDELLRRQQLLKLAAKIRSHRPTKAGPFSSTEEMQREDRRR